MNLRVSGYPQGAKGEEGGGGKGKTSFPTASPTKKRKSLTGLLVQLRIFTAPCVSGLSLVCKISVNGKKNSDPHPLRFLVFQMMARGTISQ